MPKGYWVTFYRAISDADAVAAYAKAGGPAIVAAGGKFLARTGPAAVIAGPAPRRAALIAFENLDTARASFRTDAYRELRKTGEEHGTFRVYAVEGVAQ